MSPVYRTILDVDGDLRLERVIMPGERPDFHAEIPYSMNRHHWVRADDGTIECLYCCEPMGVNRSELWFYSRAACLGRRYWRITARRS